MPTTNMDRSNVAGVYGVASVNDFFHLVHDGDGHAQKKGGKPKPKEQDTDETTEV